MYGYSGYGTNAYGIGTAGILRTVREIAMHIVQTATPLDTRSYSDSVPSRSTIPRQTDAHSNYDPSTSDRRPGRLRLSTAFTLQDGNGNAVDISAASLIINVQDSQDALQTVLFSGAMTVDSGPSGTCHYTVASGIFPNPGTFLAQIVATWASSEVLTWPGIKIIVEPKLPRATN